MDTTQALTSGILSQITQKVIDNSLTAVVLAAGLVGFGWWVRRQIKDIREDHKAALEAVTEDKERCYDLHNTLRLSLDNNTSAMRSNADSNRQLVDILRERSITQGH